jgi:hypothetical protein
MQQTRDLTIISYENNSISLNEPPLINGQLPCCVYITKQTQLMLADIW